MKIGAAGRVLFPLMLAGSITGCVRTMEQPEPLARSSLVVVRTGSTATLTWESDPKITYTVMYKNRRSSQSVWKPLDGSINLKGTGGEIRVVDRAPRQEDRRYRLQMIPNKMLRKSNAYRR